MLLNDHLDIRNTDCMEMMASTLRLFVYLTANEQGYHIMKHEGRTVTHLRKPNNKLKKVVTNGGKDEGKYVTEITRKKAA